MSKIVNHFYKLVPRFPKQLTIFNISPPCEYEYLCRFLHCGWGVGGGEMFSWPSGVKANDEGQLAATRSTS